MAYLGKYETRTADFKVYTSSTATATHTLSWTPTSKQSLRITINGVVQQDDAFSLTGNTVTLDAAILVTDVLEIVGVNELGGQVLVPADGSIQAGKLSSNAVTTAKIQDDAVTLAKMAGLARGKIIVGDASGDPSALTVGGANTVLTSDGTDAAWGAAAVSKDNLPAFYMTFTGGDQDIVDAAITLINWNTSIYDTASGLNTTASGTNPRNYTVQTGGAGKWFLTWGVYCYGTAGRERSVEGNVYKNGSMVHTAMHSQTANDGFANHTCAGSVVIELVVTDYVTVYGLVDVHSGTPRIASHAGATWFAGFRLAE